MIRRILRLAGHLPARGVLATIGLVACAACGNGDAAPTRTPNEPVGTPQLVGALGVVDNPDQPAYADSAVRVDTLWRASPDSLRDAVALAVTPQRVLVVDGAARRVRSLWLNGRAGPGLGAGVKLVGPGSIAFSGGTVAVADTPAHAVVLLDASGGYLRSAPAGDDPYVVATGDGRFASNAFGGTTLRWRVLDRTNAVHPLELPYPPPDPAGQRCARVSGGPFLLQASCHVPRFQVLGPGGRVLREIRIHRPRPGARPAAADSLRRLADAVSNPGDWKERVDLAAAAAGASGEPNTVLGVRWDAVSGRYAVWSRTRGGTSVDLLSREGVYLARFVFAARWRDLGFRDGVLYAIEMHGRARPSIAAYRVGLAGETRTRRR